ncbi:hypothetical protein BKA66DRAFT_219451 [Pyrenochaeta sp. MPI-SDFR-AT-0127]|nr:hypothetical protein BKA66DRAFT_219451 [Pyrenochaeta sp. MPI-SDFR-AT-0127]
MFRHCLIPSFVSIPLSELVSIPIAAHLQVLLHPDQYLPWIFHLSSGNSARPVMLLCTIPI